jgi:esterase/lipase superfamily enzyme
MGFYVVCLFAGCAAQEPARESAPDSAPVVTPSSGAEAPPTAPEAPEAGPRTRGAEPPSVSSKPGAPAEVQCRTEFSGSCYPVWFGTNRRPVDSKDYSKGFSDRHDERIHYGKRIVYVPFGRTEGSLGSPLWQRLLTGKDDRIKLGEGYQFDEIGFARDVRNFLSRLNPRDRDVLVFIHGFNISFDETARRAAQLGFDLKVPGITAFFSWPSRAKWDPVGYVADRAAIENSEEQLAQFLVTVSGLTEPGRVHIIAHSMGNYGLLRALQSATALAAIRGKIRFGQIFLAAPDVDVQLFKRLAAVYPQIAERTTLYVADQDKAIRGSEWFSRDERVGAYPPVTLVKGIDTVQVRGAANPFLLGHTYVAENLRVLMDISTLIYFREPPETRRGRNQYPVPDDTDQGKGSWIIRD